MTALLRNECKQALAKSLPWTKSPLVISAPMRVMTGPGLAVAVSSAGGLGFLGPTLKPEDVFADLDKATELLGSSPIQGAAGPSLLPIGVGFQTWNGDLEVAVSAVTKHRPCAVWLFAPRRGQAEFDEWTAAIRSASPGTRVWLQVGSLGEAVEAAASATPPDVLVLQGAEAGGHGRHRDAQGTIALVPEVSDALGDSKIPLVAAGGIVDGRGAAAALTLGAAGVAMGTRFLASSEARISKGYQNELYNHLRGTFGWPEHFSPRTLVNRSWRDHEAGVQFDRLKELHDESAKTGDAGWGPEGRLATYVGAAVGLVRRVDDAAVIVRETRDQARAILTSVVAHL
ncbi:2-nitropropane dioxygenase precursor, partial [Metarhizium majus ARSEF 297]